MNYAFVGISERLHFANTTYSGIRLLKYAKERKTETKTEQLLIHRQATSCTVAATIDEDGNYLIYAFVGDSSAANQYIDFSTYDTDTGYQINQYV